MLPPLPEKFVEQKVADIQREVELERLVREARGNTTFLQAWTVNKMHDLSVWMMCTGERLHQRYHAQLSQMHQGTTQAR